MRLIVGLGNPGKKYKNNRHNLGFRVIDALSEDFKIKLSKKKFSSVFNQQSAIINQQSVLLAKPQTFINLSGQAIKSFVNWEKIDLKNILIICDDFNLPLGGIRIRKSGSSGGHNGLQSIIECLDSKNFPRIRLGIGPLPQSIDPADYVLNDFDKEEKLVVDKMIDISCQAVKVMIYEGIDKAMSEYNKK